MAKLNSIDLSLGHRLKDPEFRREWFRAELEASVPELFRELREIRHLTQAELAMKADMKQSAISRFEVSTEATWKLETLLRLADALDAKLSISLEPTESVMSRYAGDQVGGSGSPPRSVIEASNRSESRFRNMTISGAMGNVWSVRAADARTKSARVRRDCMLQGENKWN